MIHQVTRLHIIFMNLSGLLNLNLSFAAYDFVELLAVILAQRMDDAAPILPDDCKDPHTAAIMYCGSS